MTIAISSHLLTTTKAADMLHVSADTLRRWTEKGDIASTLTEGGHRRYREEDVLALIASQAGHEPTSPQEQLLKNLLVQEQEATPTTVAFDVDVYVTKTWKGEPGNIEEVYDVQFRTRSLKQEYAKLTRDEIVQLMDSGICRRSSEAAITGYYSRDSGFTLSAWINCLAASEDQAKVWADEHSKELKTALGPAQPVFGVVGITNARQVSKNDIAYCQSQQEADDLEEPLHTDTLAG